MSRPPPLPALLAATAVLAAAASCHRKGATHEPQPLTDEVWLTPAQSQRLQTKEVATREVGGVLQTGGKVTFDDMRVTHVLSPVTGRLVGIKAKLGERVARGAPLAVIISPDVGNAFSDLAKAQADMAAAEHEASRQRELYALHATSQRDFEAARDNAARALAELKRAREKAKLLARGSVNRVTQEFTLVAPISGEIVARNAHPGMEIQGQYSGASSPELFTVGELDRVWVIGDIYEQDLGSVRLGQRVQVRVAAYPQRTFDGRIEWIADALDPATRTAAVRASLTNADRVLKPEMYATVSIFVVGRQALAVPRTAVLRQGEQLVVFVEKGHNPQGKAVYQRRVVQVDTNVDGPFVPVQGGVRAGERVVSSGAIELLGAIS